MQVLHHAFRLLAQDSPHHPWHWFRVLLEVIGAVGLVLIVLLLLLMITMIPDLIRYLKIKAM